jgi:hypothetical protein
MNKYLKQNIAEQGLGNTGIANLYAQQTNKDYINQRAEIAKNQQNNELGLYNQYYNQKQEEKEKQELLQKEEQEKLDFETKAYSSNLLNSYIKKAENLLNDYKFIEDSAIQELYSTVDWDSMTESDKKLLESAINLYKPTEQQLLEQSQANATTNLYNNFYDNFYNETYDFDKYFNNIEEAYSTGQITREQRDLLREYVTGEQDKQKEFERVGILQEFEAKRDGMLVDGKLSKKNAEKLYKELEELKSQIGTDYYNQEKLYVQGLIDKESFNTPEELDLYSGVDKSNPISLENATVTSFGRFLNIGNVQRDWVKTVLDAAKSNKIKNGDIIDFNFGSGIGNEGVYMYYDGKFYKAPGYSRKEANITSNSFVWR